MLLQCLFLLVTIQVAYQLSIPNDDHYIAAVTEYHFNENVEETLALYLKDIEKAAKSGADIIVFPEYAMTHEKKFITVPIYGLLREYPAPALYPHLYDEILVALSSAARSHKIYILVNLDEELDCTENNSTEFCPEEKTYTFNTNVVFDREGNVIDRYRKIHLFNEIYASPALVPQMGIFQTDFGVTFGHFICFDLLSQIPSIEIVERYNIKDIISSNMWNSELPFLTAIQVKNDYAYAMNVNLLAASTLHGETGGGIPNAGIYSGKVGEIAKYITNKHSTLNIAKVPKIPGKITKKELAYKKRGNPKDIDGFTFLSDSSIPYHVTERLNDGYQEFTLYADDVICDFNITMKRGDGDERYEYRAGAYSGVRSLYGYETHGVRDCSVFACLDDTISSCAKRFSTYRPNSAAYFEHLSIIGVVPKPDINPETKSNDSTFGPTTVTLAVEPLRSYDYKYQVTIEENTATHYLELVNINVELLGFSLRGRNYRRDGEPITDTDSKR